MKSAYGKETEKWKFRCIYPLVFRWTYLCSRVGLTSSQTSVLTLSTWNGKWRASREDLISTTTHAVTRVFRILHTISTCGGRAGHLNHLFIAPAVTLTFLVPVLFVLPPESSEKITMGEKGDLQCCCCAENTALWTHSWKRGLRTVQYQEEQLIRIVSFHLFLIISHRDGSASDVNASDVDAGELHAYSTSEGPTHWWARCMRTLSSCYNIRRCIVRHELHFVSASLQASITLRRWWWWDSPWQPQHSLSTSRSRVTFRSQCQLFFARYRLYRCQYLCCFSNTAISCEHLEPVVTESRYNEPSKRIIIWLTAVVGTKTTPFPLILSSCCRYFWMYWGRCFV